MNTITVRQVNVEDLSTVIPGIVNIFRDDELVPWHRYDECLSWVTRRVERGFYSTLAYDGDKIIGFCDWIETFDNGKKILYLGMMQVDIDFRGKGIGGAMLDDGEKYAKSIGASCLRTIPEDERSYGFYRKYGFTETDSIYHCSCPTIKEGATVRHNNATPLTLDIVNINEFIFGLCQSSGRHMYEVTNHTPDSRFKVKMPNISSGWLQFRYRDGSKNATALYWSNTDVTYETVAEILRCGYEQGFEEIKFHFKSKYVNLFKGFNVTREDTEIEKGIKEVSNIGNFSRHAQYMEWGKLDHDRTPISKPWGSAPNPAGDFAPRPHY